MTAIDKAKQELAKKEQKKTLTPAQQKYNRVDNLLVKMGPAIAKALPKHITPERISRIALTSIRMNPKLLECSEMSLLGAILQAAQLGLEPNSQGQCYLIPYKNKRKNPVTNLDEWVDEVQFQVGYQGMIDLYYRSSNSESLQARVVYENDEFEYEFGLEPKLKHIPASNKRGDKVAYYAVAKLQNGGFGFDVMSRDDIITHAEKYSKAFAKGWTSPWKTDFDAMALKTVIKRVLKLMPRSVEIQGLISSDGTIKEPDLEHGEFDIGTMKEIAVSSEVVDEETGEVA